MVTTYVVGFFLAFFFVGEIVMGPDEFDLWIGEKILAAWRTMRHARNPNTKT